VSLKPVSTDKLIKILAKTGFKPIRQKGSHVIIRHPDERTIVIPIHPGKRSGEAYS
jgi:predicted RNA binding protein YcfA (HicA-like mRNA interferase family)